MFPKSPCRSARVPARLERKVPGHRRLRLESLESRELLSVHPVAAAIGHQAWAGGPAAIVGSAHAAGPAAKKLTAAAAGAGNDDYGNTIATAYTLTLSSTGNASIGGKINSSGDIDVFAVTATGTGTMTVTITGASRNGATPQLTVEGGNEYAAASAPAGGKTASVSVNAIAGVTYYIEAAGVGSSTGSYTVQASLPLAPPPSLTPPSYLPGAGAYSAADTVTEEVIGTTGGQVLVVRGTEAADSLTVSQSDSIVTVAVATQGGSLTASGPFAGIVAYGFGGDDTIRFDRSIAQNLVTVVYGGAGADSVYDAGPNVAYLYGDDGSDTLVSVGGAADVLYGGAGLDTLWCDSRDRLADVESTETAATSVHQITAFTQPTAVLTAAVPLEIAGQDLIDPAASASYTNNFVSNPLWVDTPEYNDIKQGGVGDCYFMAGLSALADNEPGRLQQSIVALGDGTYAVRFYSGGSAKYYRVDAQLPTSGSSPTYAKLTPDGELWVALLEKAFAQFRSGQNSYSSINAGWMHEAYTAITGASYSNYSTGGSTADALAQKMANSLAAGNAVTAASLSSAAPSPIVSNHAYNVHAVTFENGAWYVTVYNPWGYDGLNDGSNFWDGLLKLTASQFQSAFRTVEVCLV